MFYLFPSCIFGFIARSPHYVILLDLWLVYNILSIRSTKRMHYISHALHDRGQRVATRKYLIDYEQTSEYNLHIKQVTYAVKKNYENAHRKWGIICYN